MPCWPAVVAVRRQVEVRPLRPGADVDDVSTVPASSDRPNHRIGPLRSPAPGTAAVAAGYFGGLL